MIRDACEPLNGPGNAEDMRSEASGGDCKLSGGPQT